jgi:hypothetical protein
VELGGSFCEKGTVPFSQNLPTRATDPTDKTLQTDQTDPTHQTY